MSFLHNRDKEPHTMIKVGYARVSTSEQSLDIQKDALKNSGCKKIFTDTISGAKTTRPGLDDALDYIREGDTLVVWKLDRLGRSTQHLIETVKLLGDRGIGFQSLQESIDTTTGTGRLVFHIFSALAEFERDLIRERTNAGLKAARARGRIGGRPPRLTKEKIADMITHHRQGTLSIDDLCKLFNISRPSFYNYIKRHGQISSETN
jgi:DNA invertase Pin-like site-specific DNA recombinase